MKILSLTFFLVVIFAAQGAIALSLTTVQLVRHGSNTLYYCTDFSESALSYNKVKEIIAKSVRMNTNQTVRIVVGSDVPSEDFFRVLSLYADLGITHVSVIHSAKQENTREFYLRVHQLQEGENLDMNNFDGIRSIFVDGKSQQTNAQRVAGDYRLEDKAKSQR